ncbi:MAG TPA: CRISPR-associated protein Cas4 [Candidatus Dorea intestinavium]|nr:CRISPR-associated protein Cas4 [Candidatus Dorea intestinavium]
MHAYTEDDFLMISGIQHFLFCKRQWSLIHIEQQWQENVLTLEGQALHEKADQPEIREKRGDKIIIRAMPVHSFTLGVTGICDVVELIKDSNGIAILDYPEKYRVVPVEYKRGKPKKDLSDTLQLAAQAVCLEEMLLCNKIDVGYVYYNEIKHREEIILTDEIREELKQNVAEMHHYFERKWTPKVKTGSFCKRCSIFDICLPELNKNKSVKNYLERKLQE